MTLRDQSSLQSALVESLSDETLELLAARLRPHLLGDGDWRRADDPADHLEPTAPNGWMDTKAAARYLGMSVNAVHKLSATRAIPFQQDVPGGKLWFSRADLDRWRRNDRVRRTRS